MTPAARQMTERQNAGYAPTSVFTAGLTLRNRDGQRYHAKGVIEPRGFDAQPMLRCRSASAGWTQQLIVSANVGRRNDGPNALSTAPLRSARKTVVAADRTCIRK